MIINPYRFATGTGDPYWGNVALLLNFDGADGATSTVDSSSFGHALTMRAGATLSTAQKKFGTASMKANGTGPSSGAITQDAVVVTSSSALSMDAGDFTIEGWAYLTTTPTAFMCLVDFRPVGVNGAYPTIYVDSSRKLVYYTTTAERISGGTVPLNQFVHFALSRFSGVTRLFLDGVQINSFFDSNNYTIGSTIIIGASGFGATAGGLGGYLDELRVTKGIARYQGAFTPPSAPFPTGS